MRSRTSSIRLTGISNLAVTAPIKAGFIDGFETITYVDRLSRLLAAVNAARVAARESSLLPQPFPDAIGRFDIIRSFRYAVIPPEGEGPRDPITSLKLPGSSRLSLNVTFDAGWEPYMRVIYRDVGTLLDALFCHSPEYPGSRTSPFDVYSAWVRNNELDAGLYYLDSPMTLGDEHYLGQLERLQRAAVTSDRAFAELAVEPVHRQRENALAKARALPGPSFFNAMRAIKGFYRLSALFPPNANDESGILIRFAQAVLSEFYQLDQEGVYANDPTLLGLLPLFKDELAWFRTPQPEPTYPDRLAYSPEKIQAGIVQSYADITHGCVVLLRIEPEQGLRAARFLASFPLSQHGTPGDGGIERNIAFTYQGLDALGVPGDRLDAFPQEFFEGMEKRASLLGDVRTNHPDNWTRPLRNWPPGAPASDRIDLSTVHIVLLLRWIDPQNQSPDLHPKLGEEIKAIEARMGRCITVLGVQPTRSYRLKEDPAKTREHFGFIDGLSQPIAADPLAPGRDNVPMGEILLGYRNDRDRRPFPMHANELLDDGSYLVLRKLRQNVGLLKQVVPNDADQESMMGRALNGNSPIVNPPSNSNDFDYVDDANGAKCPFHSHVRRTNPRDGRPYIPRLMRRGMSYGSRWTGPGDKETERGLIFMAFCASVSEQFEVVQRWVAGANSTGVSSSQSDPLLGVPELGEDRWFRSPQGANGVTRVNLGKDPFITLEWGLYLFVPSIAAIKALPDLVQQATPEDPPKVTAPPDQSLETWQNLLEDTTPLPGDASKTRNQLPWQYVRSRPNGVLATEYGLLVGNNERVLEVLQDDGEKFSVRGYGQRMRESIGLGYLGLDPVTGHDDQGEGINKAIEAYDQVKVFRTARPIVDKILAQLKQLARLENAAAPRVPVDLAWLSEQVLGALCTIWFGLPDDHLMRKGGRSSDPAAPATCPGHLFTTSRYVFGPHPNPRVVVEATAQGRAVQEAFKKLLASGVPLIGLSADIRACLQNSPGVPPGDPDFLVARTIAGIMLGFPPTVYGNFLRIMDDLNRTQELWDLQQRLLEAKAAVPDAFDRASKILYGALIASMRKHPVPDMIWRTSVNDAGLAGVAPIDHDKRVVLGLASAVTDPDVDHHLMFGGSRTGKEKTVHACPGYDMAMGTLLALLSGLLEAGQLRPTGSTLGLTLI